MASRRPETAFIPGWVAAALFDALTGRSGGAQAEALTEHYDILAPPFAPVPSIVGLEDMLITRAFAEGGAAEAAHCPARSRFPNGRLGANQVLIRPAAGGAAPARGCPVAALPPSEIGDASDKTAPAFLQVGGKLISANELGPAEFKTLGKSHFKGSFAGNSVAASHIHARNPGGLTVQTRTFKLPLTLHPSGAAMFIFLVTLEYDGFNIFRASVAETKTGNPRHSSFHISFRPKAPDVADGPVTQIGYVFLGRWVPDKPGAGWSGRFRGGFRLNSQGQMSDPWAKPEDPSGMISISRGRPGGGGTVPSARPVVYAIGVGFVAPLAVKLSGAALARLEAWAKGLPDAVRKEVEAGNLPVQVIGRPGIRASARTDRDIAGKRAAAVAAAITGTVLKGAQVETRLADERAGEGSCDVEIATVQYA